MDCLFCKIIAGEVPSYKIYEDEKILAFLDINPTSPGHTLIIPKKHYLDIHDLEEELLLHIVKTAKMIAKKYEEKLNCKGFSLCQNNGLAQEVKHFHMHVIPKYEKEEKLSIEEVYEIIK